MRAGEFALLILVVGVVIAFLVVVITSLATKRRKSDREALKELAEYEALVDNLREIAYDHRDLDSRLSVIITDEIRAFENRHRKELR